MDDLIITESSLKRRNNLIAICDKISKLDPLKGGHLWLARCSRLLKFALPEETPNAEAADDQDFEAKAISKARFLKRRAQA